MTKYCGKDLLIQKRVSTGPDVFTTIGNMTATSLTVNNEQVDVTDKSTIPWRQLLACGVRSMDLSCSGKMSNDTIVKALMTDATSGSIIHIKVISGLGDTFEGDFLVSKMGRDGEYNGAEQFSIDFASGGTITYTGV